MYMSKACYGFYFMQLFSFKCCEKRKLLPPTKRAVLPVTASSGFSGIEYLTDYRTVSIMMTLMDTL